MTNVEIAKVLLKEAKDGRLDAAILPHFINSLQYGSPVQDPKAWIERSADTLEKFTLCSPQCKEQLRDIAARWDSSAARKM